MDTTKNKLIGRRVLLSTIANYVGQFVTLGTGFFLTPFMLATLGETNYGLWVLVGSLVAYGTLFDLGISGAVVKYVAEYRARGEVEQARGLVATALWLYTVLGLLVVVLCAVIAPFVPAWFNIPNSEQATARWLVLLSGIGVGLSIPCSTPAAVLKGLQRFDLINLVSVTGTLLVAAATVVGLLLGGGVLGVVAVNIPIMLVMQVPSIWLVRRAAPELRFGWRGGNLRLARTVVTYSSAIFITQISGRLQTRTDEIVIGGFLPVTAVTPFAIARRLSEISGLLTNQFMKVLFPLASELHAENDQARLRSLYIIGTRLTLATFLPIGGATIVLARAVLSVWVGEAYGNYAYLVVILTLSSFIDTSQWPAGSILQGMARHRPLAVLSSAAALLNLALSIALVRSFGLVGVALGTLIPTTIICLGFILPFTMQVIGISVREALENIFLPALLPAVPMAVVLYGLQQALKPSSVLAIMVVAGVGVLVYVIGYISIGANTTERQVLRSYARSTMLFATARFKR